MFILPRNSKKNRLLFKKNTFKNNYEIFSKLKSEIKFLKINKGQILIFSQNCPHGNIVNKTKETRVSFNCRFKSLFSPYHEKSFIEYFEPIKIKPATQLGLDYEEPKF
jgi:sporadic carbohydrate cluster 2OG-Fe(II) oxygenase